MSLKHLLSELLVPSILHSVDFESVGVGVDEMVLSEQVTNGVNGRTNAANHSNHHFSIRHLVLSHVGQVFTDIMSHLRG